MRPRSQVHARIPLAPVSSASPSVDLAPRPSAPMSPALSSSTAVDEAHPPLSPLKRPPCPEPSPFEIFQTWTHSTAADLAPSPSPSSPATLASPSSLASPTRPAPGPPTGLPPGLRAPTGTAIGPQVWTRLRRVFELTYLVRDHVDDLGPASPAIASSQASSGLSRGLPTAVWGPGPGPGAPAKAAQPLAAVCDALILGCRFESAGRRNWLLDDTLDKLYHHLYPINRLSSKPLDPARSDARDLGLLLGHLCAIAVKILHDPPTPDAQQPLSAQSVRSEPLLAFARSPGQLQCIIFAYSLLVLYWVSKEDVFSPPFLEPGSSGDACCLQYLVEVYSPPLHSTFQDSEPIDVIAHLERLVWVSLLYPKLCASSCDQQVSQLQHAFGLVFEHEYSTACRGLCDEVFDPPPNSAATMLTLRPFDFDPLTTFQHGRAGHLVHDFFQALALVYRAIFNAQFRPQLRDISNYIWELTNKSQMLVVKQDLVALLLEPFSILGDMTTSLVKLAQKLAQEDYPSHAVSVGSPGMSPKIAPTAWTDWILPINSISKSDFEDEVFFPLLWDTSLMDRFSKVCGLECSADSQNQNEEYCNSTRLHNILKTPAKLYQIFHPHALFDLQDVYQGIMAYDANSDKKMGLLWPFEKSSHSADSSFETGSKKKPRKMRGCDTLTLKGRQQRRVGKEQAGTSSFKGHKKRSRYHNAITEAEVGLLTRMFLGCSLSLTSCASNENPTQQHHEVRLIPQASPEKNKSTCDKEYPNKMQFEYPECAINGIDLDELRPKRVESAPSVHSSEPTVPEPPGTITTLRNGNGSWVMSKSILKKPATVQYSLVDELSDTSSVMSVNTKWWLANPVSSGSLREEQQRGNDYRFPEDDQVHSCFYPSEVISPEQQTCADESDMSMDSTAGFTIRGCVTSNDTIKRAGGVTKKTGRKKHVSFKIDDEIIYHPPLDSSEFDSDRDVDMDENPDTKKPSFTQLFEPVSSADSNTSPNFCLTPAPRAVDTPEVDGFDFTEQGLDRMIEEEGPEYDTTKTVSTRSYDSVTSQTRFFYELDRISPSQAYQGGSWKRTQTLDVSFNSSAEAITDELDTPEAVYKSFPNLVHPRALRLFGHYQVEQSCTSIPDQIPPRAMNTLIRYGDFQYMDHGNTGPVEEDNYSQNPYHHSPLGTPSSYCMSSESLFSGKAAAQFQSSAATSIDDHDVLPLYNGKFH